MISGADLWFLSHKILGLEFVYAAGTDMSAHNTSHMLYIPSK